MKKTVLNTVLLTLAILVAVGAMLLTVFLLLPDRTGQIHSHETQKQSVFLTPATEEELVLYPWGELAGSKIEDDDMLGKIRGAVVDSLSFFLPEYWVKGYEGGTLFQTGDGLLTCVRDVRMTCVRIDKTEDPTEIFWDGETEAEEKTQVFSVSLGFLERGGLLPCYLEIRPVGEKPSGYDRQGYEELCRLAANPENEGANPFRDLCYAYNDYVGLFGEPEKEQRQMLPNAVMSGKYATFLYENEAYFFYSDKNANVTVFCDPTSGRVIGFSVEPL